MSSILYDYISRCDDKTFRTIIKNIRKLPINHTFTTIDIRPENRLKIIDALKQYRKKLIANSILILIPKPPKSIESEDDENDIFTTLNVVGSQFF